MKKRLLCIAAIAALSGCLELPPDQGATTQDLKVVICHIPPGNPSGQKTLEVGSAAVTAHYAHGDYLGVCQDPCVPSPEVCDDELDNDCDGVVDDGCVCAPDSTESCYDGTFGSDDVGVCQRGTKTCNSTGTAWSECVGQVLPSLEICDDELDNDCDGFADDGCVCDPDSTSLCYEGPNGTEDVGVCQAGTMTCNSTGTGYGACMGQVLPSDEFCDDALDNDCDGVVDNGCCVPTPETCDSVDNDCDGSVDEGCVTGHVWDDTEGAFMQGTTPCDFGPTNGLQEGEPSVAGVVLSLRSMPANTLVGTATSDLSGNYSFSNVVAPGSYRIELTSAPPGMDIVGSNQGSDDTVDSDFLSGEETPSFVDFLFSGTPLDLDLGLHRSCGT